MARLRAVDDATFAEVVERAPGLVAVDFTAAWCGPCRVLAPVLEQLAADYAGSLEIVALDVDLSPTTAGRYGVRAMPTVLFFREGLVVDRSVGAVPKGVLEGRIRALLEPVAG